jgi:hypothetical protein
MTDDIKVVRERLAKGEPFTGYSMTGLIVPIHWFNEETGETVLDHMRYAVKSFDTLIAWKNLSTGETWITPSRISTTTQRHIAEVRKAWDTEPTERGTERRRTDKEAS